MDKLQSLAMNTIVKTRHVAQRALLSPPGPLLLHGETVRQQKAMLRSAAVAQKAEDDYR